MIERIIAISIRHRWLVIAAAIALGAWGVWSALRLPIDAIPDLSENQVIVFTDWPGHGPAEINERVTLAIAGRLRDIPGTRTVRTSSDVGFSSIHVIFDDLTDQGAARGAVAERLVGVEGELPAGARPRLTPDAAATGQIFWYTLEGGDLNLAERRALQDSLVGPRLADVEGVVEVAPVGGFTTEVGVEVDPRELVARGISLAPLEKSLAALPTKAATTAETAESVAAIFVETSSGESISLGKLATVSEVPAVRYGVLEKNGSEAVGGVVLMRRGENPLAVTRRIHDTIISLQPELPAGVRIVTGYDRTPLIRGAIGTVWRTLLEATFVACLAVLVILRHVRSSLVIATTLPIAVLAAFAGMWSLRHFGWLGLETNIMSLAGLAISIGVLVDSSIVMTENVLHQLRLRFGERPVTGDVSDIVREACQTVGRPIFFSVAIMLLSFLPVFALDGLAGKMFRPLAATKTLAMLAAAILAITLVPALCAVLVRGRVRSESSSWIMRSVAGVYQPVLDSLLDRPGLVVWIMGATLLCGLAPLGIDWLWRLALLVVLVGMAIVVRGWKLQVVSIGSLMLVGLVAQQLFQPLPRAFLAPLDEQTIMDMPITVPRTTNLDAADDLKARDMVLCRFPEVEMVMGKAGRALTATDPAPIDMIETMIGFRPREVWPRRSLDRQAAERQADAAYRALVTAGLLTPAKDATARQSQINQATAKSIEDFDLQLREFAYQRQREALRELRPELLELAIERTLAMAPSSRPLLPAERTTLSAALDEQLPPLLMGALSIGEVAGMVDRVGRELTQVGVSQTLPINAVLVDRLHAELASHFRTRWAEHVAQLDGELAERGAQLYTRLVLEELLAAGTMPNVEAADALREVRRLRKNPGPQNPSPENPSPENSSPQNPGLPGEAVVPHHGVAAAPLPDVEPVPGLAEIQAELSRDFSGRIVLRKKDRVEITAPGGELDRALQMPGWANVWTMPIQNRVDMLATGVNTDVGICVLGPDLDTVVETSERIAAVVKTLPGASGVVADPIRGKQYLDVRLDPARAAKLGVDVDEAGISIAAALGGHVATHIDSPAGKLPVRLRFPRIWRDDRDALGRVPVAATTAAKESGSFANLGQVASLDLVEGPATIKGEKGELRNYVRLNVRGPNAAAFVAEAQQIVSHEVKLPPGVRLEWTGQFAQHERTMARLALIVPATIALILVLLYWTYRDLGDALLMLLAVPGAIAGGVLLQWLLGETLSITVLVGYLACFGMATATGVIMLVYLREAVAQAGDFEHLSLDELRQAVLTGAVQRLRPKLLTELTTIVGLAPMLWATGVGAEVIRPMAVPVLGGILVADEVIDLFLPVMFYWVRRRRLLALRTREQIEHESGLSAAA